MPFTSEAWALSRRLAAELGQAGLDPAEFIVYSRTRAGHGYAMARTPEGYAVHQGQGCEGELFNGPLGCWHSKEFSVNNPRTATAIQTYQSQTPAQLDFTRDQIDVIKATIAKGCSDPELQLFVATCQRTGLDPFARQIYAIKRAGVMSIQIGIDGMRLIAERTGKYAGGDGPQWSADGEDWVDAWANAGHPKFARYAAYRKDLQRPFIAVARWESYAQDTATWNKMPDVMLAKCAESLALRRAFPAEMSGLASSIDHDYDAVADTQQGYDIYDDGIVDPLTGEIFDFDPDHDEPLPEPGDTEPVVPEHPAPPPPDKMPGLVQAYRAMLLGEVYATGVTEDAVEAAAQAMFGNKAVRALTPGELQALALKYGVEANLPGQPYLLVRLSPEPAQP